MALSCYGRHHTTWQGLWKQLPQGDSKLSRNSEVSKSSGKPHVLEEKWMRVVPQGMEGDCRDSAPQE